MPRGGKHGRSANQGFCRRRWAGSWSSGLVAATNLTPALLFSIGSERKTLGPAILELAGGDAAARSQAAALALAAVLAISRPSRRRTGPERCPAPETSVSLQDDLKGL